MMIDRLNLTATRIKNGKRLWTALPAVIGGIVMVVGTILPWVTLFAGLQVYAGTAGLNGKLMFGGGALSVFGGLWFLFTGWRILRWGVGLLGFACLAFAGWLLVELIKTNQQISNDPFIFAHLGPGLFITTAGALIVFTTLLIQDD